MDASAAGVVDTTALSTNSSTPDVSVNVPFKHLGTVLPARKKRGASLRKSTPKARSGCISCKRRKIRCDEARPACLNCQRLKNHTCEGYEPVTTWMFDSRKDTASPAVPLASSLDKKTDGGTSEPLSHLVARKAFYSMPMISTSFGTENESRSFAYYTNVTATVMSRRSEPYFWSTLVTQLAWQAPSVKHSLLAMAQIDEALDISLRPGSKAFAPKVAACNLRSCALHSYSLAIRAIMSQRKADIEILLISCACLFAFENYIGNLENATKHIEGAMKLVEDWKKQHVMNTRWKSEHELMAKHIIPMIEGGVAYHRISMKAGTTASNVIEPPENRALMPN